MGYEKHKSCTKCYDGEKPIEGCGIMAKIGRNDPCPCGSGKKYKNCCMKKDHNVVDFQERAMKQDLERLQWEFAEFTNRYEKEISEFFASRIQRDQLPIEEDYAEDYAKLFMNWAIMNVPLLEKEQTIFQEFMDKHGREFRPAAIEMAKKWETVPGMYEILDHLDEDYFVVQDFCSGRQFTVNFKGEGLPGVGNGLMGILVPFGNKEHQFLLSFQEFDLNQLLEAFREFQGDNPEDFAEMMRLNFPAIANRVFTIFDEDAWTTIDSLEWQNDKERLTAELFCEKNEGTVLADARVPAIHLWHRYCIEKQPRIGKEAVAAAALEYLVNLLEANDATQKEAAKKYGVSSGAVSQRFLDMEYLLMEIFEEIVDAETGEEPEDLQFPGPGTHIAVERELRALNKALEENEFTSKEELDAFLKDWNHQPRTEWSRSKKDQAQDLVDEAWQQPPGQQRARLAKRALQWYANTPDAYVILAQESRTLMEMKDHYYLGMVVGEKELGPEYFTENRGHFWGLIETRPYMRAKQGYAECMRALGDNEEAISQYQQMLELNPNDNQGIRYHLLTALLETKKYKEAKQLMDQYPEPTANMEYNQAFLQYMENGWTEKTDQLLLEAVEVNPHVPDYLLGKKPIPEEIPEFVGMGDENEAIDYAQNHVDLWRGNKKLLQRLTEIAGK